MDHQEIRRQLLQYNSLYKEMDDVYHSLARHYGISDCAFWILYMLRETEHSLTQSNICEQLFLSKQTVNSALKNLEKAGYVVLKPLNGNQKNKQIQLTSAGDALAQRTIDCVFTMEHNAFAQFPDQERTLFLQLKQKYVTLLQQEAEKILNHTD